MKYLITSFFLFSTLLMAQDIYVRDSIELRSLYLKTYPTLFGNPAFALESDFKKTYKDLNRETRKKVKKLIKNLDPYIPAKFLRALVYWKYISPNQVRLEEVLLSIQVNKLSILRDYILAPNSAQGLKALEVLRELIHEPKAKAENFYSYSKSDLIDKASILAQIEDAGFFKQAMLETKIFSINLKSIFQDIDDYSLDPYGLSAGNEVELISENQTDQSRMNWVNKRSILNGGSLDFRHSYMNIENHPVFEDAIFKRMKKMVKRSKESILIDISLFGGTMGGAFSKFLIDQALEKKKGFKLLILHDYATNNNMNDGMMPIFEYIKKRIQEDPNVKERVFLLQSNIQRHPPGVPFNLPPLVPKTSGLFSVIEAKNTYHKSKRDHSKLLLIDGNSPSPEAYFGSKNWTDHSGSYNYDNALWVKGPAAALIQNSYVEDIEAALTENKTEQALFFYKEQGFDNLEYLSRKLEILESFKIKRDLYPAMGQSILRIAEANVDGKIKNVRNSIIDQIKKASNHIYMEQLFLYDSYIVDALILKKRLSPSVSIKILVDNNEKLGFNGFPNTIFIQKMKDAGIEIRTRKTIGAMAYFKDGSTTKYNQENHRKISSFDGKTLIVGSSNLNPDTLQGSFRELGAVVYNKDETKKFDLEFEKSWSDRSETQKMNIEEFRFKLGGTFLNKLWSTFINDFAGTILRSKDDIERRY
jgi:phosphatidylserine/phosphatidylglycerophosphate/cardiolipin synthase-like enzyme